MLKKLMTFILLCLFISAQGVERDVKIIDFILKNLGIRDSREQTIKILQKIGLDSEERILFHISESALKRSHLRIIIHISRFS